MTITLSKPNIKLSSPRLTICRVHSGGGRAVALTVLVLLVLTSVMTVMMPTCGSFFPYNSWKNVSVYNILKMHLSGRPTHVTPLHECKQIFKPSINASHINMELVKRYDNVNTKMDNLMPEDEWKQAFRPLLDVESKKSLLLLYGVLQTVLKENGIRHLVMHGTAMGAWRHHGITPWDDDMDLAIDVADWYEVREILSCLDGYTLDVGSNSKWGFFKNDGYVIQGSDKRWPFLDIFLYTHDGEYAWALNYVHMRKFVFRVEDLFPAQLVPFECFLVPAPRHLRKVLEQQYATPATCMSHYMDHKMGITDKEVISRPCSELTDMYKMYFTSN